MERKLIALVVVALLLGLGGGYGLGYVIYQPQTRSLRSNLGDAQAQIANLNPTLQTILGNQSESLTKYEKLQFISAYAANNTNGTYTIHMTLRNIGTAYATIDPNTIFYNGEPGRAYAPDVPVPNFVLTTLPPGSLTGDLTILLPNAGSTWASGMSVEVMIQTTSGSWFPTVIVLSLLPTQGAPSIQGAPIVSAGAYFRFWIFNNIKYPINVTINGADTRSIPSGGSIDYDVIAPQISAPYEKVTYRFVFSVNGAYLLWKPVDYTVLVLNSSFVQIFDLIVPILLVIAFVIIATVAIVILRRRRGLRKT